MGDTMTISKSEQIAELLESNNIPDSDVIEVIDFAESGGTKFYEEGTDNFLGIKRLSEITLYVEYSPNGEDNYKINKVYWHGSIIDLEEFHDEDD
ncbi:MAG: hypothetical protein V2J25_16290 [Desulfatiglans sp.]|jgi:hypothetical protein|nr:hypothetical protein [Thermodesulfobacteriota bacterium]MEE4354420.1 hypothetical protein [Desulfatiglans sp.]